MAQAVAEPWPTEIKLSGEGRRLTVTFDNGSVVALSSQVLRLATPSVEAKRPNAAEREAHVGTKPVRITAIEAVGSYAIRPTFDDGHSTGIYSWEYLAALGRSLS